MSIDCCVKCASPVDTDFNGECYDMIGKCLCPQCEDEFRENPYKRAIFSLDCFEKATLRNYQELKEATQGLIQHIDHVLGEIRA